MSQGSIVLESGTNELEIIEFYLDEKRPSDGSSYRGYYGMNVAKVLEIIRRPVVTGVPSKHHSSVLGTFNLRGRVMPLIDLGAWLGKSMEGKETAKVIVSEFSGVVVAFLVSGVTRIHRMSWKQVEAPGKHVHSYSNESVTGVVRFEDRILFILDMEKIVSSMDPTLDMEKKDATVQVPDAHQFNLLIADDSTSIRNMMKYTLSTAGYRVTTVGSGVEAWAQLQEWKREALAAQVPVYTLVHLIISDIEMPEMDGHALTRLIKEDPDMKVIPVVLFSSLTTDTLKAKSIAVGADEQLSKPDLPRLTSRVRSLISEKLGL